MPRDSNGIMTLPASTWVQTGDTVLPVQHNPPFRDIENALTNSIDRDGRTVMTGPLQMGGNRVTGLGDPSLPGDAMTRRVSGIEFETRSHAEAWAGTPSMPDSIVIRGDASVDDGLGGTFVLGHSSSDTIVVAGESYGRATLPVSAFPQNLPVEYQNQVRENIGAATSSDTGFIFPEKFGAKSGLVIEDETRSIFDAMVVKPTHEHLRLIDETVRKIKRLMVWDKIGTCFVPAAHTEQAAFVDWRTPGRSMSKVGQGSFTPGKGVAGAGSTISFDTLLQPSDIPGYSQNDAHLACYVTDGVNEDPATVMFQNTNGNDAYLISARSTTGEFRSRLNNDTSSDSGVANSYAEPIGYRCASRSAPEGYRQFVGLMGSPFHAAVDVTTGTTLTSRPSTGLPNGTLAISATGNTQTVGVLHAGAALMPYEVDALEEIWREYLLFLPTAMMIGVPVTAGELDDALAIDPAENLTAFHECASAAVASGLTMKLSEGTYVLGGSFEVPSNLHLRGAGQLRSRIRTDASVVRGHPSIKTGDIDDPRHGLVIEDLWVDFNINRITAGGDQGAPYGNAVALSFCRDTRVSRLEVSDAYKHCIDVAGSSYNRSGTAGDELAYIDQQSRNVVVEDCRAYGAGDDAITTHTCDGVEIRGCWAGWSRAIYSTTNSNGLEVDDFSLNVKVLSCYVERVHRGLEIKGHADAAAARGVIVDNIEFYKCRRSAWFRHQGYDTGSPSDSARDIIASNIRIRHPLDWSPGTPSGDLSGFGVTSYENVLISNALIAQEAAPDDIITGSVFYGASQIRNLQVAGLQIIGFTQAEFGVRITNSSANAQITNLSLIGGPKFGFSGDVSTLVNARLRALPGSRGAGSGGIGVSGLPPEDRIGVRAAGFSVNIS